MQHCSIVLKLLDDCLYMLLRSLQYFLTLIDHSSFFPLDDVKTTLFLVGHAHITKQYITQHSLLIIEAYTHAHIHVGFFSVM